MKHFMRIITCTLLFMLLGGMLLGVVVPQFTSVDFWSGISWEWDLVDKRMLVAFVLWSAAFFANLKNPSRLWVIVAWVITFILFAISCSLFG